MITALEIQQLKPEQKRNLNTIFSILLNKLILILTKKSEVLLGTNRIRNSRRSQGWKDVLQQLIFGKKRLNVKDESDYLPIFLIISSFSTTFVAIFKVAL